MDGQGGGVVLVPSWRADSGQSQHAFPLPTLRSGVRSRRNILFLVRKHVRCCFVRKHTGLSRRGVFVRALRLRAGLVLAPWLRRPCCPLLPQPSPAAPFSEGGCCLAVLRVPPRSKMRGQNGDSAPGAAVLSSAGGQCVHFLHMLNPRKIFPENRRIARISLDVASQRADNLCDGCGSPPAAKGQAGRQACGDAALKAALIKPLRLGGGLNEASTSGWRLVNSNAYNTSINRLGWGVLGRALPPTDLAAARRENAARLSTQPPSAPAGLPSGD